MTKTSTFPVDLVECLYQTYDHLIELPMTGDCEFDPTEPMFTSSDVKRLLRISKSNYVFKLRIGAIQGYAPPGRPHLVLGLHSFYDLLAIRTANVVSTQHFAFAEEALDKVAEIINCVGCTEYCRAVEALFYGLTEKRLCAAMMHKGTYDATNVRVAYCTYRLGLMVNKLLAKERTVMGTALMRNARKSGELCQIYWGL
ncbi:MAG: hypothetical protein ACK4TB_03425 [Gemmobacter sp.]